MKPHRRFLYAVRAREWVLENAKLGGLEGEYHKKHAYRAKYAKCHLGIPACDCSVVKLPCLKKIDNRGGEKENGDVNPVGGASDYAVVGVKKHGNERKSKKHTSELDAPIIFSVLKIKALYDSINKHWPEEQLHVLPRGFVYTRKGRNPHGFLEPIV